MDLDAILEDNRERIRRMVLLRIDPRVAARVDASDVVQETYLEAAKRFPQYQREPEVSAYIWLRFLAGQKLIQLHRMHLGAAGRDARREVSMDRSPASPLATSTVMARQLAGQTPTPSRQIERRELRQHLQSTLDAMEDLDREIIALRHFEHLDNKEAAVILNISPGTAYKRYVRALKRIRSQLDAVEE